MQTPEALTTLCAIQHHAQHFFRKHVTTVRSNCIISFKNV